MSWTLIEIESGQRQTITNIEAAVCQGLALLLSNQLEQYKLIGPKGESLLHHQKLNKLLLTILNWRLYDNTPVEILTRYYGIIEFSGCKFVFEFNNQDSGTPLNCFKLEVYKKE